MTQAECHKTSMRKYLILHSLELNLTKILLQDIISSHTLDTQEIYNTTACCGIVLNYPYVQRMY